MPSFLTSIELLVTIAAVVVLTVSVVYSDISIALFNTCFVPLFGLDSRKTAQKPPTGIVVAFELSVFASLLTILQILQHLLSYRQPQRQRFVIRILLMVPIYAIDSFWAMLDFKQASFIAVARDTYEAYALYNFFHLLLDLMGGVHGCVASWKSKKMNTMHHSFPLTLLYGDYQLNAKTVETWRFFVLQYTMLSPVLTLLQYIATFEGIFDESSWSAANLHVYFTAMRCVSVTLAFTALFYCYSSTKKILHSYHPLGKFIAIKVVVFLCFWQGIVVQLMAHFNVMPHGLKSFVLNWYHGHKTLEEVEETLCNLLLCAEMFGTAILHHFVFNAKDYKGSDDEKESDKEKEGFFFQNLLHAFSVSDIVVESKHVVSKSKSE